MTKNINVNLDQYQRFKEPSYGSNVMKLKPINKITFLILNLIIGGYTTSVTANDTYNISLGAKILSTNWKGSNTSSGTDFKRSEGGQFAWSVGLQKDRFYTGLSLQAGNYTFSNNAPDQVTNASTVAVSNVQIKRSELDLLAGYYFWDNVSLFVDLKSISNDYDKNSYKQVFTGIGLGVAGAWPLNNEWSLYGSYGFVARGDVKANSISVGTANSAAIEVGTVYRFAESHRLNFGLKTQGQKYNFNNGTTQTHNSSGLFIGYNFLFSL